MYTLSFERFVSLGVDKYYIGTGNPNSKILLVGKESAISDDDKSGKDWYSHNAKDWESHIQNKTCEILEYLVDENHVLRNGWGRNTWSKYQLLSNYIFEKNTEKFKIDFLKSIFTTEINDAPNKNTSTADKKKLNERKTLLKNSEFIQEFPVVVIACSEYIKNNDKIREIDDIFGVSYDGDETGKHTSYSNGNWFYTHHNISESKLVIHTRQLSANVNDELLQDMGIIIREHLTKNGLIK